MNYPPRLNRREASKYLYEVHGIRRSPETLAKYASGGGGPVFQRAGRGVTYTPPAIDSYAAEILSPPMTSTSDRAA